MRDRIIPATGSYLYWSYADYHVGFATMLLQIGIFGYLIFVWFWLRFYRTIHKIRMVSNIASLLKSSLLMFLIGLAGILFLHFISYQYMGFEYSTPSDYFFICLFFIFADNQIKETLKYKRISHK